VQLQQQGSQLLNKTTAPLLLMVLAMLYGGNVPLLKSLQSTGMSPPMALIFRFMTASMVALPVVARNRGQIRHIFLPACELALYLTLAFSLQIMALGKAAASVCSVALACTGVVVQLLELIFDRRPVSPSVGLASIGTLAGIALFNSGSTGVTAASRVSSGSSGSGLAALLQDLSVNGLPGEVLALLSTVCLALQVWRSSKIVQSNGHGPSATAAPLAALQCLLTSLFSLLLFCSAGALTPASVVSTATSLDAAAWLRAAACGVLCTGLPMLLELPAFGHVPPATASLIYGTTPVWGLACAALLLGEPLRASSLAAGALILACAAGPSLLQAFSGRSKQPGGFARSAAEPSVAPAPGARVLLPA